MQDSRILMEKLTITRLDHDIFKLVGARRMTPTMIADELGLQVPNVHNKLTTLCARGLMRDSFRSDGNRAGLHTGEKRRVYTTTKLGNLAESIYSDVQDSLIKTGTARKRSLRTTSSSSKS